MNFRVSARTILHLGSELISSDGIAFYELIKNSLDARSPEVRVEVLYRMDYHVYAEIMRALGEDRDTPEVLRRAYRRATAGSQPREWHELRAAALSALVLGAPEVEELQRRIERAGTHQEFVEALRSANRIEVDDDGDGMSMDILEHIYLTIGTSFRARQKHEEPGDEIILGEKGLGRLSAMRLGDRLLVVTGQEGATKWNQLEIDWNDFADAADEDLESIHVQPEPGNDKAPGQKGTLIRISALRAEWSQDKLEQLAIQDFSKLVDPFDGSSALPLSVKFNGADVAIPKFSDFLLEHSHGRLQAKLVVDGPNTPRIEGLMEYRLHGRQRALRLSPLELHTITAIDTDTLKRIGAFDLDMYWFNRRLLTRIEGIGSLSVVRRLLADWTGGISLYRDGFRVNPYGGPNDDWLDLDRDAFSTSGFKLNRGQIVGRSRITQHGNPYLIDQTNREGLKDNAEKRAFVKVLAAIVELYRQFLNEVDRDIDAARRVTAAEALDRFKAEDERVGSLVPLLESALGRTEEGPGVIRQLRDTLTSLRLAAELVQRAAGAQEKERSRVLHLASIGLMIEILAHELYRATAAGLDTIAQARRSRDESSTAVSLRVLDSQLRTLQKRLKVLDPLSTNARQTKESFELVSWIEDVVGAFASRNDQTGIEITVDVVPIGSTLPMRAVKGMFVQVLENLLTNSVFWVTAQFKERQRLGLVPEDSRVPVGHIRVEVDTANRRITVTDDGPGIPEDRRDTVFEPFFSTKPQKQGRGLGLYIAREIAEYHGGTLTLGPSDAQNQIHSVIFEIGSSNV